MTGTTFVLLDDSLTPGGPCFLFEAPAEVVQCDEPENLPGALEAIASAGDRGLHAADTRARYQGIYGARRLGDLA